MAPSLSRPDRGFIAAILFTLVFAYFWITLTPFSDESAPSFALPWAGNSNLFNQILVVAMSGALLMAIRQHPARSLLLQPRTLLVPMLAWFSLVSLAGEDPASAFRRIVFAVLVCFCAGAVLLLPRSEKQFAKLLAIGLLFALMLSYFGVLALPGRAIHQSTDALEAALAGDWRGHFGHKNMASAAMVIAVFCGLYVMRSWSRWLGLVIAVLAAIFLFKAGGKSASAMLPIILALAWVFERWRSLRALIAVGGPLLFNIVAVGASVFEPIRDLVSSLGVDATFTNRSDVWRLAMGAIAEKPITGYGFQIFWQTDQLRYGGGDVETWAVTASHAHNAYIEALINAGIPGLAFVVIWLLVLPIGDADRAKASGNDPALTRLFIRIWLFSILSACLESTFFSNAGPLWFTMLIAVFGLRLQARASLVTAPADYGNRALAHA
jgi:O-antigen ligase